MGRKKVNKGIGIDTLHYLNDGLWKVSYFKVSLYRRTVSVYINDNCYHYEI